MTVAVFIFEKMFNPNFYKGSKVYDEQIFLRVAGVSKWLSYRGDIPKSFPTVFPRRRSVAQI